VGSAGTVPSCGALWLSGTSVDPAPAGGERDFVADPDGRAVAGSAGGVRVVADRVWPASDMVG